MKNILLSILILFSITAFAQEYIYKYNPKTARQDLVTDPDELGDTAVNPFGADTSYWGRNGNILFPLEDNDTVRVKIWMVVDASGNDTTYFYDDGDTTYVFSNNNPIKIGNSSLVIKTNGDVEITGTVLAGRFSDAVFSVNAGVFTSVASIATTGNVTVGNVSYLNDTTYFGDRTRQTLAIDNITENDTINNTTINITPTSSYTGGTKTLKAHSVRININEGNDYTMKNSIAAYESRMVSTTDSLAWDLYAFNSVLQNNKGYVNSTGSLFNTSMMPIGVRAKTSKLRCFNLANQIKPTNASGSLAEVEEYYYIQARGDIGNYYTTTIDSAKGISIWNDINAQAGANTTLGKYYGFDLRVGSDVSAGTRSISDFRGFNLINTSGITATYGIYEDFGPNYFTNKITTPDTVDAGVLHVQGRSQFDDNIDVVSETIEFNGAEFLRTKTTNSVLLGYIAGDNLSGGTDNTFIGYAAGVNTTTSSNNTFVGSRSGFNNTGNLNTFIGYDAGFYNTTGFGNCFLGYRSGFNNSQGISNTFMGQGAGTTNTTGDENVGIGNSSGLLNSTGNSNTFIGYESGRGILGACNVTIGNGTGYAATGSNNIFLGYNAGYNESGSDKLYIANSNTATPLIYGEFDNNYVKLNVDSATIPNYLYIDTVTGDSAYFEALATGASSLWVGGVHISEDGSNNLTFEDAVTGTKTLAELTNPTLTRSYNVFNRARVGVGGGAAASGQIQDVPCILFNATQEREAFFSSHIEPNVDLTSVDPILEVHFIGTDAATSGLDTVRIQLEIRYRGSGEGMDGAYDETITQNFEVTVGTAYIHGHTSITLDRTLMAVDDVFSVRIARLGNHSDDDYANILGISQIFLIYSGTGGM